MAGSFIDSRGILHEKVAASLTFSTAIDPSVFSIGSTPMAININRVFRFSSFDGSAVTVTPDFNFSIGEKPTKGLVGRIIDAGSSSISLAVYGLPPTVNPSWVDGAFTFATDSSTALQGITALNDLSAGMTVEMDADLGSGGAFRATKVELENANASEVVVDGLTLSTSLAQLDMLVREVHGPSDVSLPEVGKVLTVGANASTQFHLEPDDIDLNNLDFTPTFDALTIAPGQNVRAGAASGSATTVTADQLKLEKQSLDGIAGIINASSVSGQYSFPFTIPADSAFAKLTGQTTVYVTVQPSTQKHLYGGWDPDCLPCIAGDTVRVRGLLFFSAGQYHLVAESLVWWYVGP